MFSSIKEKPGSTATIPYKANLDGSAEVIAGLIDEDGPTAIAGVRNTNATEKRLSKVRIADLKGRVSQELTKDRPKKAYYKY